MTKYAAFLQKVYSKCERGEGILSEKRRMRPRVLAVARSLLGSNSPPDCYSLPRSRFATPEVTLWGFGFLWGLRIAQLGGCPELLLSLWSVLRTPCERNPVRISALRRGYLGALRQYPGVSSETFGFL